MSSADLVMLIRKRHPSPEWAVFEEVANATGFKKTRSADVVAYGIWPSRGFAIHGFEIKCSRSDWLREKNTPEKADAVARYCDYWWLVVDNASIAPEHEVPESWGLLVRTGSRLKVARAAPKQNLQPLSRSFVAAMLRQVGETTVSKVTFNAAVSEALKEQREKHEAREARELLMAKSEITRVRKSIDAFEQASGIRITEWEGPKLGQALRAYMALGSDATKGLVESREVARKFVVNVDEFLRARRLSKCRRVANGGDLCDRDRTGGGVDACAYCADEFLAERHS